MAEITTVARPYAQGVYRLAKEENSFAKWTDLLNLLGAVLDNPDMQSVVANPNVTPGQVKALLLQIAGGNGDAQVANFLDALLDNGRVALLPEIARQYVQLRDELEGVVEAGVASAFPLDDAQLKTLVGKLEAQFKRKIEAKVSVEPELIGGVRITVGDEVIDASVRGKLQAMAYSLKS